MNQFQAMLLGIVEGLTEYLPVSSTGHLILTQRALGIPKDTAADAYAICIQAGAILAVMGLYWPRMLQMVRGGVGLVTGGTPDSRPGLQLGVNIVIAFLPAAIVGVLLDDWIEARLFSLWYTVFAWLVGGLAILVLERTRRGGRDWHVGRAIEQMTWRDALTIGLIQCIAMWPGTSRSLVTILGGVYAGLSLASAVEFSFLLGVVTLLAATVYKLKDAGPVMRQAYGWPVMLVGTVAAWIAAVLAVKWMVEYLKRHGMQIFGYYRVVLAIVVASALWAGWLSAT